MGDEASENNHKTEIAQFCRSSGSPCKQTDLKAKNWQGGIREQSPRHDMPRTDPGSNILPEAVQIRRKIFFMPITSKLQYESMEENLMGIKLSLMDICKQIRYTFCKKIKIYHFFGHMHSKIAKIPIFQEKFQQNHFLFAQFQPLTFS